jgi:hypothetical protein
MSNSAALRVTAHLVQRHFELDAEQGDILELDPLVRIAKRRGVRNFPNVAVDHAKKDLELVDRDKWQVRCGRDF